MRISASTTLDDKAKVGLTDLAWSTAAFERSYRVLMEDILRAERVRNDGAPAIMVHFTGPYEQSLLYLVTTSLWMDLGEFLTAFRTIPQPRPVAQEERATTIRG